MMKEFDVEYALLCPKYQGIIRIMEIYISNYMSVCIYSYTYIYTCCS